MYKTIVLISCCAKKKEAGNYAEVLYDSDGFKARLAYSRLLDPDGIFVISALHHVIPLTEFIEPYNVCLEDFSDEEKREWAKICWRQLDWFSDCQNDKYIILAGKDYYEELIKGLNHYEIPIKGLAQGEQLAWLKSQITCDLIHSFANSLPRFSYPFDKNKLPKNGIYFFFEKGEKYKEMDRIVRIGTHDGDNNLPSRLSQHVNEENKDRSIFRKNIVRAILNKKHDPFLSQWNIDLTTRDAKDKYSSTIDFEKMKNIESQVSEYMRNNLSFSVFEVATEENRHFMEKLLIERISAEKLFCASKDWLGNYSPEEKIGSSGMWLKQHLSKEKINKSIRKSSEPKNKTKADVISQKDQIVFFIESYIEQSQENEIVLSSKEIRKWTNVDNFCANKNYRNICRAMKSIRKYDSSYIDGKDESSTFRMLYKK